MNQNSFVINCLLFHAYQIHVLVNFWFIDWLEEHLFFMLTSMFDHKMQCEKYVRTRLTSNYLPRTKYFLSFLFASPIPQSDPILSHSASFPQFQCRFPFNLLINHEKKKIRALWNARPHLVWKLVGKLVMRDFFWIHCIDNSMFIGSFCKLLTHL